MEFSYSTILGKITKKIDITIFLHLHFYKKSYAIVYAPPPFPPTHKSQIPIGGGWGSCGMQTKGTVLLVCICQRHTKRTVPLVCGLRLRLESATPQHQRRPPREVGGIAKRIKTARLRRKTR